MCIRICTAETDDLPEIATWDPDEVSILVRTGTHHTDLIRELHALLADLGAPTRGAGLTCFCGDPVDLPSGTSAPKADASTL
ncbi:hypothetical protein ACGFRG_07880 [Streptomyces sp. NPDC048696]|uniref:hypothetical protein n=1 Tax=Streptomyces sp. NPDC048696 TaxID=3365585 RepID=UPI003721A77E